jgi:hypothetical protein
MLLGVIAAFWSKLKAVAWRIINLVVVRAKFTNLGATIVGEYLWANGRRSQYGEKSYSAISAFVRSQERRLAIGFEQFGNDMTIIWFGWKPIMVWVEHEASGAIHLATKLTISFLRGTFSSDELVKTAIDEYNANLRDESRTRFTVSRLVGRPKMATGNETYPGKLGGDNFASPVADTDGYRLLGYKKEDIGPPIPVNPLGALVFPPIVEAVIADTKKWLASERWYRERQIPWRFGLAFTGNPGTGKTSLAKALAQQLNLPLFALEIATYDDQDMISFWHTVQAAAPCIAVLEDIDTTFHGRENVSGIENGLNFGCLLNCLSGVEGADGILTIVTTNRPETLDPALGVMDADGRSSRPGRIDRVVELPTLDESCRRIVASRILDKWPEEVEPLVTAGAGDSGAQFTDRCAKLALKRYWAEKPADPPKQGT